MQKQLAIKILIISFIALLLLILISMVKFTIHERQDYLKQAKASVAQSWTGPQLMMTPILVIPYRKSAATKSGFHTEKPLTSNKFAFILPDQVSVNVTVANKNVFKGIYKIPIYKSNISLSGEFTSQRVSNAISKINRTPNFEQLGTPYISFHISDTRGIDKTPSFIINQQAMTLQPGSQLIPLPNGFFIELPKLNKQAFKLNFSLLLSLRGMNRLSFIPLADDANITMHSDWPHPKFIGSALPSERKISTTGFNATWSSSRYSNSSVNLLKQCIASNNCHPLLNTSSGTQFIEPVDIYLQAERSIKYAILFIGLSFIAFFIFEQIKSIRIHPIQYTFVGLAIAVFYLLLISLSEHIAFYWAYLIAVSSCLTLLLFYMRCIFKNLNSALLFSSMILLLYGLLYIIIQAEDFSLLMGSLLVFIVLSTLMFITRKIDWYNLPVNEKYK